MSIEIAAAVLAEARELDRRIEPTPGTIKAWANCFGLHRVWRAEALEAVHRHYGRANAYPLMPGDVIAHCERQHPWVPCTAGRCRLPFTPLLPPGFPVSSFETGKPGNRERGAGG